MDGPQNVELTGLDGAVSKVEMRSQKSLGTMGGTEEKTQVETSGGTYLRREPVEGSVPAQAKENPVGYTWSRYKLLKSAGLPVVEMSLGSDGALWCEHLTTDGSVLLGKSTLELIQRGEIPTALVGTVYVIEKNYDQIFGMDDNRPPRNSLWWWMEEANRKGIALPADDAMELHIRPDGTWQWIIVDPVMARSEQEMGKPVSGVNVRAIKALRDDVLGVYRHLVDQGESGSVGEKPIRRPEKDTIDTVKKILRDTALFKARCLRVLGRMLPDELPPVEDNETSETVIYHLIFASDERQIHEALAQATLQLKEMMSGESEVKVYQRLGREVMRSMRQRAQMALSQTSADVVVGADWSAIDLWLVHNVGFDLNLAKLRKIARFGLGTEWYGGDIGTKSQMERNLIRQALWARNLDNEWQVLMEALNMEKEEWDQI